MDLNYLLERHQVALHRAQHATCDQSRFAHQDVAESYAAQIAERKRAEPGKVTA